ncbi:hypothetical protein GCM10009117_05710 [Gangjinia marincola]|uniref:Uncharacterized protein n=1 Tax=Gangjinia marincola TaxID=578463 RepID=A0ABN1MEX9_9FLAO
MLIQIFLDNRMIIGMNTMRVTTIQIKDVIKSVPRIKKEITKAATENAIPNP